MQRFTLVTLAFFVLLSAGLPAAAQDSGWSIGVGLSGSTADPDDGEEVDFGGLTIFGRWQHKSTGWGAMAELRGGEDDDKGLTEFDYGQLNLYGTYTWRRDKTVRPFVKLGISTINVEVTDDTGDDRISQNDTSAILGAGVEIGRGRWAFHFSTDSTEARIDAIDPRENTYFGSGTFGVTYRF